MGVYYKIINPVKRQYLSPFHFGEPVKWPGLLRGQYCLEALKFLISDAHKDNATQPWHLGGSWVGDPVIISGDDISPPNPSGFVTATEDNPRRNLNLMAEDEFYNISHLAIAMLAEGSGHAEQLVKVAEYEVEVFVTIADLLMQIQPPNLKREFDQEFGHTWIRRYKKYTQQHSWHRPLPLNIEQ